MIKNIPKLHHKKEDKKSEINFSDDDFTETDAAIISNAVKSNDKYFESPSDDSNSISKNRYYELASNKISDTYDRKELDNHGYIRDEFVSEGITEVKDAYTGEQISISDMNEDHVIPLKNIHEKYKNNPLIKKEQLKKMANSRWNLRSTNASLNKSKGAKTNSEYVEYAKQKGIPINKTTQKNMLSQERRANVAMNVQATAYGIANSAPIVLENTIKGAAAGATTSLVLSTLKNAVDVVQGKKDIGEAAVSIGKDTKDGAIYSGKIMGAGTALSLGMIGVGSQIGNETVVALAQTGLPVQACALVLETGKSIKKYVSGEINGEQCALEIAQKGTGMLGATIGGALIPVPIVGNIAGAMIGYEIASSYYSVLMTYKDRKLAYEERIRIETECAETLEAIRAYRREAERIAEAYFADHKRVFEAAFSNISQALQTGDADGVISGANMITEKLGGEVQYRNMKEFDEFMNDEDVDFVL